MFQRLYIGDQKIDMPPKEMFARYREGDPVKLGEVAEYCIKDTLLPHKLMKKMCTSPKPSGDGESYLGSNVFPG
jgi:hypothetical protein